MSDTVVDEGLRWEQLSGDAMRAAYEHYRDRDVQDDWWDCVYEDAVRMGALMGITIDTRPVKLVSGKTRQDPDIRFSGFWSQGDGASYTGSYAAAPDAVKAIKAECNDEELLRIATELTQLQIAYGLMYGGSVTARITRDRSNYCHEMTMDFDLGDSDDEHFEPYGSRSDELKELLRDFARWIYKQLEAEHEYLTSEEHVFETLASGDYLFDEDGRII